MKNIEIKEAIINYDNKIKSIISLFVENHPFFTYKFMLFATIWIVICISSISMMAALGMSTADKQMQDHKLNGITDANYNNWNNIVKPIFPLMLYTMQFLVILFIILTFYIFIRYPFTKIA
jgi:hypothetical protein